MELNKYQAAKSAGISRTTLDRHIKQGKISIGKDGRGRVVIDVTELERVYGRVDKEKTFRSVTDRQVGTGNMDSVLSQEINTLRERLSDMENERSRERRQLQEVIDDLRDDRDHWRDQAKKATALLEDKRERKPVARPKRGGLFSLFGGDE
jgi:vacuolar-type H+-ATPase subunit I/STV1